MHRTLFEGISLESSEHGGTFKKRRSSVAMKGMVAISSLKFDVVTNSARKERCSANLAQHKAKLNLKERNV